MKDKITENESTAYWRHGNPTVLVADDEPAIRACVRSLLEGAGFKVLTTDNGYSALSILQEFGDCIDVLLLDMNMPIMSGDWVLREMKTRRHSVPVIIYSGMGKEEIHSKCRGAEIHSILSKPCSSEELLEAVIAASKLGNEGTRPGNPADPDPAGQKTISAR